MRQLAPTLLSSFSTDSPNYAGNEQIQFLRGTDSLIAGSNRQHHATDEHRDRIDLLIDDCWIDFGTRWLVSKNNVPDERGKLVGIPTKGT